MCGEDGVYMHLTRELIGAGNLGPWGNLTRILVHEWGHLRWGLFDEYPTESDRHHFYLNSTGGVEPVRCSRSVTGDVLPYLPRGEAEGPSAGDIRCDVGDNIGHLPDRRCRFQPHNQQMQDASGSLMFTHNVNQVTGFCHSNISGDKASLHNAEAPNRQNALCDGRSAWDVMLSTADFANGANPPREGVITLPQFSVKRQKMIRVVLVLDTSGTMNDNGKLQKLIMTGTFYLTEIFQKGTWVALVQFNDTAAVAAPLTEIRYKTSRQNLLERLPDSAGGNKSIGAGVLKALEVLSSDGQSPQGGFIFIMSDGLEDTAPFVNDIASDVQSRGVILDATAYSSVVKENFFFSRPGEDPSFSYLLPDNYTTATEKPIAFEEEDEEFQDSENFLTIVHRSKMVSGLGNGTDLVHIDSTVGKETIFRFIWEKGNATAVLRRPDGSIIEPGQPEYHMDMEGRQVEIRIPDIAQNGTWRYGILNMNNNPQTMLVHVYSRRSDDIVPPIRAKIFIKKNELNLTEEHRVVLYGEVTQGELPVIMAKVRALVKRPEDLGVTDFVAVDLFDHGTGADTQKEDGIYSAYFTGFTGEGVYQVTLEVENEAVGHAKKLLFPSLSGVMPPNWNDTNERVEVDIDPFMRATQQVEFTVISAPTMDGAVDMFPPSRVTDLRVAVISRYQGRLVLEWTAPGGDYDSGKAANYDLRCSRSFEGISDFENAKEVEDRDIIYGDLSSPGSSGSLETVALRIPTMLSAETDLMMFLAFRIRAVDEAGQAGETSNIATVVINYGAGPTTAFPTSPSWSTDVAPDINGPNGTSTTTTLVTTVPVIPGMSWERFWKPLVIVLSVCVLLVVCSTIILIIACRTSRRTKDAEDKGTYELQPTRRVSDAWVLEEI